MPAHPLPSHVGPDRGAIPLAPPRASTDADAALHAVARTAARLAACPIGLIALERDGTLQLLAAHGTGKDSDAIRSLAQQAWTIGGDGPMVVADLAGDGRFEPPTAGACVVQPLWVEGRRIGILMVVDRSTRTFDTGTPSALADLATIAAGLLVDGLGPVGGSLPGQSVAPDQARWQRAAHAARLGIAEFDLRTGQLHFDAQASRNHGLGPEPLTLTIDDWMAQIDPADRAAVREALRRARDDDQSFDGRYLIQRSDGSRRWLEFAVHGLRADGPDCEVTSLVGICRDVHELQSVAESLRAKQIAERANRAKSDFLSRVSHELRTPLNAILGFAQMMALDRERALTPVQSKRLDSVQRAGRHLLELINDMLSLTRIEREDFRLASVPVGVDRALHGSLTVVQPLADDRGVNVVRPPPSHAWVRGDARALEQVLMNLLSNAIHYNRPRGRVDIAIERRPAPAGHDVVVRVSDTGHGLDAGQRARLFEPFERLGADQQGIDGSGLGLVIVRHLLDAMGGSIEVESEPQRGSTFSVVLPASEPPRTADAADQATDGPASTSPGLLAGDDKRPAARSRKRVVYIEDEPLNQLLLEEVFRSRPHWLLDVADDGASGLARVEASPPDLVLIDMHLPDMGGAQVLAALRKRPAAARLRCIALSADAMQDQIDAARAAGFDDYWTKPIDIKQVLKKLDRMLDDAS